MSRPIRGERGMQKDFSRRAGVVALVFGVLFLVVCAGLGYILNGGIL